MPEKPPGHFQKVTPALTSYWLPPWPSVNSVGWAIHAKPFMKLPIMAHEAKEISNLCVSL